jgi:ubiquinone/menaquinone biosynthesis C-methylase UbiE/uncharacterized membrane protein YbhN (UPF0104 family)
VNRPPRRIAWVLLLASASAVLLTGVMATILVLSQPSGSLASIHAGFWVRLAGAAALTILSLMLRSLRWVFLLRRAQTRIPIRDAYIGYFAGLSLLFAPLLIGEIAVRAFVHRARGQVPVATTVVVNLWERMLDLTALAVIAGASGLLLGAGNWIIAVLAGAGLTLVGPIRRLCLSAAIGVGRVVGRLFDHSPMPDMTRLTQLRAWTAALATSVVAWLLPGIAFWWLLAAWDRPFGAVMAEHLYALSSMLGGVLLAPGGVLITGARLLAALENAGFAPLAAALSVFGIRLASVGVATVLGGVYLLVHLRTPAVAIEHFDEIADAYDVQIPESRRAALLTKKTELMRDVLGRFESGRRGLDVGCGQGAYVARMRALGFEVSGIDASAGQVALAARNVGASGIVLPGSVLAIPAADASFDFVYIINVLHHLGSVEEQRKAFGELLRVLKPGGLLFVHEINTRNMLFRFYMGYVFPSLNCIDEGVERWLLPHRMAMYTDARLVDVRYFTFFPDFLPQPIVRLLAPIERMLERSALSLYSAHYMAVLQKA